MCSSTIARRVSDGHRTIHLSSARYDWADHGLDQLFIDGNMHLRRQLAASQGDTLANQSRRTPRQQRGSNSSRGSFNRTSESESQRQTISVSAPTPRDNSRAKGDARPVNSPKRKAPRYELILNGGSEGKFDTEEEAQLRLHELQVTASRMLAATISKVDR